MPVLQATNLTKIYGGGKGSVSVRALDSFNLTVEAGDFVGIMGPSGSGKTTLLQLLGTIDAPTSGEIVVNGEQIGKLKDNELALFRRRQLGFIFQDFNLLDSLTLRENMMIPLVLEERPVTEITAKLTALADQLGITPELDRYPHEVSGGQKQRAAAARALMHRPALLLADEPTGNLDSTSANALMESLALLNEQEQATVVMVTHDPVMASYTRRILFIKDGRLFNEVRRGSDRGEFFQQILHVLSAMGGGSYDLTYARR